MLGDDPERRRLGGIGLGLGDVAVLDHFAQDVVAPGDRLRLVLRAAVLLGRLGQDRQEGHLGECQLIDVLVEIGAAGRLHAEAAPAERDFVEVECDDFLLAQDPFDAPREDHFLQLAADRVFVADEDILRHLLGDRRAALGTLVAADLGHVVEHRAQETADIDSAVGPEGLVLRRGIGVDQLRREILELQLDAVLAGIGINDPAVVAAHHRG